MVLSKSSHYTLRAALYIAQHPESGYISIKEITRQLDLSFHFTTKLLQRLTQSGLLLSCQGPMGGVRLARPPKTINLRQIVEAIEGPELFTGCLLGLNQCSNDHPCPVHRSWTGVRQQVTNLFEKTTLAQLVEPAQKNKLRLTNRK
ncbi:MAG: HTH-type transcriptional regulator IscR [bacterium ADurb.Bin478]|nr:MAG: HTH-type transcriptional regulator IscR [bacterium ADurb.Bin478]